MTERERPSREEEPKDSTQRLLLIGTSLVGLVLVAVWLLGGGADGTQDDQPEGATGDIETTSTSDVSPDEAPGSAEGAGTATQEGSVDTPGTTEDRTDGQSQTPEELSIEACHQFEEGRTVADFADWFEEHFTGGDAERSDVFRAVLTQALTVECPEVVPDS